METQDNTSYEFDSCINDLIHNIDSLATTLPLLLRTIDSSYDTITEKRNKFLEANCEFVAEKDHYLIHPENRLNHKVLHREEKNLKTARKIINRNYVVSLISQFDDFIGSMIRTIYYLKPELLNASEKNLSFSELLEFNEIKDAREYIIEKEIETVLRNSHLDHFKWFENKLKINLRKDLSIWPKFIEVTERRNLYVHNNGKISSQYVKVCKSNGYIFSDIPVVGTLLSDNEGYFNESFECIFELGFKLNQVIRRKLFPADTEEADKSMINITFELIENEQYDLAKSLLDFDAKYIKSHYSDDLTCRMLLNRAQVYRWLGDVTKSKNIINSRDWSASSDIFRLASNVLLENYEEATKFMKKIGNSSELIVKSNYRDWPIFRDFRKTETYKKTYKNLFEEEEEYEVIENENNEA